jgi:ABC-type enterochelin transport system substrate-binding protein
MKVIIAGGRKFKDYESLKKYCDYILQNQSDIEIVSGTARGADRLGERYAEERGFPIKRFPAKWDEFGNSAGYIRNFEMAKYADGLIAFWNGISSGTKHMIDIAKKEELKVRIFKY